MTEYQFNDAYASKVRRALQIALDGATRDEMKRVEATSAILSLALDMLAVEMPLAEAKQFIRDQLGLVTASRAAFGETQAQEGTGPQGRPVVLNATLPHSPYQQPRSASPKGPESGHRQHDS